MSVTIDDAVCKKEAPSGKAILVEIDGTDYWIPNSQVLDDSEVWQEGQSGRLVITDYIADEKGLDDR